MPTYPINYLPLSAEPTEPAGWKFAVIKADNFARACQALPAYVRAEISRTSTKKKRELVKKYQERIQD